MVGPEGFGEEDPEVSEPADADDADAFARAAAFAGEGRVEGDAAAEHGGGRFTGNGIGDFKHKVAGRAVVGGISTI